MEAVGEAVCFSEGGWAVEAVEEVVGVSKEQSVGGQWKRWKHGSGGSGGLPARGVTTVTVARYIATP